MLNLILEYTYPQNVSTISGIPPDWNRSGYNKENRALQLLAGLITGIKSKYVLISFNSEGFIGIEQMKDTLNKMGKLEIMETRYNAFRGSRNFHNREIYVKEYLFLLEK
jgi:adenine-specific DNA-methyltransferase